MDQFGKHYTLSDYGGTHDDSIGGVISGCPKGIAIDFEAISLEMARRAPSSHFLSTQRNEPDQVEFLTGIIDGFTTGDPIEFKIRNKDVKPNSNLENILKPSHASYTYKMKYGIENNKGIGRASARQTACRVVAGAIAKQILALKGITIESFVDPQTLTHLNEILKVPNFDDSIGAKVNGVIRNLPAGLGEPVYDKFHARLGYAMLSINAVKGFEIGKGFETAQMMGSAYNDTQNEDFSFNSNNDGGVQAGITNGQDVHFSVAFKPIPTIQKEQKSVNFQGESVTFSGNKRNDICVVPRVLPVVEAMAAMVVLDFMLISQIDPIQ
jgi:chorismate synthase